MQIRIPQNYADQINADPSIVNPHIYQNVADPQHWRIWSIGFRIKVILDLLNLIRLFDGWIVGKGELVQLGEVRQVGHVPCVRPVSSLLSQVL